MVDAGHREQELPVSYHTFIYPFSYAKGIDSQEFDAYFEDKVKNNRTAFWMKAKDTEENSVLRYNAYQYFLPKARNILFPEAETSEKPLLMKRFIYNLLSEANIVIKLKEKKEYKLSINQIVLELVAEQQIGLLTFELVNYEAKKEEEINVINEFGRRVFAACIGKDDGGNLVSILTAEKLVINGVHQKHDSGAGKIEIYFNQEFQNGIDEMNPSISLAEKVIFEGKPDDWKGCILPVLDDRMYVACLMRKDHYTPITHDSHGYLYLNDHRYTEQLYKFIFLESGDSTCQNVDMMREKLEEHVYRRWTDKGTVHGVTEYSFVCVTGESEELKNSVINPFLSMYTVMAKLVLLQRAAITRMEQRAQEVSQSLQNTETDENTEKNAEKIKELWQKYVLFQNTLLIPQATFQEQGVELYEMLTKFLKIRDMNAYLEEELKNLFNYAQMEKNEQEKKRTDKIDKKINVLAVVGTVLAIFSLAEDIYASLTVMVFGGGQNSCLGKLILVKIAIYAAAIFGLYRWMQPLKLKEDIWEKDGALIKIFKPVFIIIGVLLAGLIVAELIFLLLSGGV